MMMLVTCTECHKAGQFDIELVFWPKREHCSKCGHEPERTWRFNFCILPCFIDWMKKNNVAEVGFPCSDCYSHETGGSSGFFMGFKENGVCKTCDGKKTVKGRLVAVDPMADKIGKVGNA